MFSAVVPLVEERKGILAGTAGLVACAISQVIQDTAFEQVPQTFRGAIATGKCMIDADNKIFIGPAVAMAAALMEKANGAFILLTKEAAELVENPAKPSENAEQDYPRWKHDEFWPDLFVDYLVPMNDGTEYSTKVVNPFVNLSHQTEKFKQIRLNYRKAMTSDSSDVQKKCRNTEALFDRFEELSRVHWETKALAEDLRMNHAHKA